MPAKLAPRPWSFCLEELSETIELTEADFVEAELDELVVRALGVHLH